MLGVRTWVLGLLQQALHPEPSPQPRLNLQTIPAHMASLDELASTCSEVLSEPKVEHILESWVLGAQAASSKVSLGLATKAQTQGL